MNNYVEFIEKNMFPCILRPFKKGNYQFKGLLISLSLFFGVYLISSMYLWTLPLYANILLSFKKSIVLGVSFYIMQELEPDMRQNYPLALVLAGISLIFANITNILGMLIILCCSRILSRSSGFKSSFPELILITCMSLYLFFFSSYTYALMCALTLVIDYSFDKKNTKNLPFIIAIGSISIIGFFRSLKYLGFTPNLSILWIIGFAAIAMIFALRISFIKTIYSANDTNIKALSPKRIKALNSIILLTLFIESFAYGTYMSLISLWALTLGLSLPYLKDIRKILK